MYRPPKKVVITESASFSITNKYQEAVVVLDTSSVTVVALLPSFAEDGDVYWVKKSGTVNSAILDSNNKLINGKSSFVFTEDQELVVIVFDAVGNTWNIQGHYTPFVGTIGDEILQDGLIYGGATWTSGLNYDISEVKFILGGVVYVALPNTVTLSAADPTNPRIDVIVANTDGTISVVEGTPAANPVKPEIDFDTQVEVTFAEIAALATTPTGVTDGAIYLENAGDPAEWNGTVSATGTLVLNSVADPFAGTLSIEGTNIQNNDKVTFVTPTPINGGIIDILEIRIKSKGDWSNKRLRLGFFNGTDQLSDWVNINDGYLGFNSSDISDYQLLVIPRSDLNVLSQLVDTLILEVKGGGANIGFYIDNIRYVEGVLPPITSGSWIASDGTDSFAVETDSVVEFLSSDTTIVIDASNPGAIDFTAGGAALNNIFTADGTLTGNRVVTQNTNTLTFNGSPTGANDVVTINMLSSSVQGAALELLVNGTNDGYALRANVNNASNSAVYVEQSGAGPAIIARNDGGGIGGYFVNVGSATNTTLPVLRLQAESTGTPAAGFGSEIQFWGEPDAGAVEQSAAINVTWTDPTDGAEDASFEIELVENNILGRRLALAANGALTLDGYGSGSITGTAAYALAVDASGNIIEEGVAGLGNIYSTDGTIPEDRDVTIADGYELRFLTSGTNPAGVVIEQVGSGSGHALSVIQDPLSNASAIEVTSDGVSGTIKATNDGNGGAFVGVSTGSGGLVGSYEATNSSTNTILTTQRFTRSTTGTAANGIGMALDYLIEDDGGGVIPSGMRQTIKLTDVTDNAHISEFDIQLADGTGGTSEIFKINGSSGLTTLSKYGAGSNTGTATQSLAVDTNGNIIEEPITEEIYISVYDSATDVDTVTAGKVFSIPATLAGYEITAVSASIYTLGSTTGSETIDIQLVRKRGASAVNVLSTAITLAGATEYTADDGAINTSNDDVAKGDILKVEVTNNLVTSDAQGLGVVVTLTKP